MALTDLLDGVRRLVRPLAAATVMYCGSSTDKSNEELIDNLCQVVWLECGGLPGANYQLGNNYDDCIQRGSEFLHTIQNAPKDTPLGANRDALLNSLRCVASGDYSCDQLESDVCNMPENDLYACIIDDIGGC